MQSGGYAEVICVVDGADEFELRDERGLGAGWEGGFTRRGVEGNEAVRGREGGTDERLGAERDVEGCETAGEEEPSVKKAVRD